MMVLVEQSCGSISDYAPTRCPESTEAVGGSIFLVQIQKLKNYKIFDKMHGLNFTPWCRKRFYSAFETNFTTSCASPVRFIFTNYVIRSSVYPGYTIIYEYQSIKWPYDHHFLIVESRISKVSSSEIDSRGSVLLSFYPHPFGDSLLDLDEGITWSRHS